MAEIALTRMTLERTSTAQQVAAMIRNQLLNGEIRPGARLPEEAIASSVGVSRNTVREAIQILAAEGVVRRHLHRGAVVSELSPEELADVYQARRVVEMAGIRAAPRSSVLVADLESALQAMGTAIAANHLTQMLEADLRFHEAIVAALKSERVSQFYRHVQTEIRLTRAWTGERESNAVFYARHKEIVDALAGHDYSRTESLVATMIDDGEARILRGFQQTRQ